MRVSKLKVGSILALVIELAPPQRLHAQDDCGEVCKINSNLAMVLNIPVSSTAQVTGIGWGATGGVGYNFNSRNAIIGEFLWNRMYPSGGVLLPLQATTPQLGKLDGNSNLYALTGNYRYEFQRH
ncbi:MAG TPA: hypothetical protein VNS88_05370, partial [Nitrospiraceae bacterium]|nr:hypothetical protein [Nitrospiraceae bacterium]